MLTMLLLIMERRYCHSMLFCILRDRPYVNDIHISYDIAHALLDRVASFAVCSLHLCVVIISLYTVQSYVYFSI